MDLRRGMTNGSNSFPKIRIFFDFPLIISITIWLSIIIHKWFKVAKFADYITDFVGVGPESKSLFSAEWSARRYFIYLSKFFFSLLQDEWYSLVIIKVFQKPTPFFRSSEYFQSARFSWVISQGSTRDLFFVAAIIKSFDVFDISSRQNLQWSSSKLFKLLFFSFLKENRKFNNISSIIREIKWKK